MYVLRGLAGEELIALIMIHVYLAVRPEKPDITKSMGFGSMSREHYLEHRDPARRALIERLSTNAARRFPPVFEGNVHPQ